MSQLLQRGEIVCDLTDLLFTSGLRLSTLAGRVEEDRRRLDAWAKNRAERFHLDTLARLCAIFGDIPVQHVLRYVPPPPDTGPPEGLPGAQTPPPTRAIAVVRAQPALPQPYGRIAFLWEQEGWAAQQLAAEINVRKETLEDLASGFSHSIARTTLVKLCWWLGGIEKVMRYIPPTER